MIVYLVGPKIKSNMIDEIAIEKGLTCGPGRPGKPGWPEEKRFYSELKREVGDLIHTWHTGFARSTLFIIRNNRSTVCEERKQHLLGHLFDRASLVNLGHLCLLLHPQVLERKIYRTSLQVKKFTFRTGNTVQTTGTGRAQWASWTLKINFANV